MEGVVFLDSSHETICEAAAAVRQILAQLDATGTTPPAEPARKKRKSRAQKRREHREHEAAAVQETAPEPEPEIETEAATEEATDVMSIEYLKRVSPQLVRDPTRTWYWTLSAVPGHPSYLRAAPSLRAEHDTRIATMREHFAGGSPHARARALHIGRVYTAPPGGALREVFPRELYESHGPDGWYCSSTNLLDVMRRTVAYERNYRREHFLADSEEAEWLGTRAIPEPITSKPNRAGA